MKKGSRACRGKQLGKDKGIEERESRPGRFSNVVSNVVKDVFGFHGNGQTEEVEIDFFSLDSKNVSKEMESICYVPSHPSRVQQSTPERRRSKSDKTSQRHVQILDPANVKLDGLDSYPRCETLSDSSSTSYATGGLSGASDLDCSKSLFDSEGEDNNANDLKQLKSISKCSRGYRSNMQNCQLGDKVQRLECMYEDLLCILEDERRALLKLSQERETTRKYLLKNTQLDMQSIIQRVDKLESHVVSLARSIAHISSDLRQQSTFREKLVSVQKEVVRLQENSLDEIAVLRANILLLTREQRLEQNIKKLKKFFGDDPSIGLLEGFLRRLGYETYTSKFEKEKVGILELPYLREDQFEELGIPCGPRQRILAHIKYI